jgi:hypothetical protein
VCITKHRWKLRISYRVASVQSCFSPHTVASSCFLIVLALLVFMSAELAAHPLVRPPMASAAHLTGAPPTAPLARPAPQLMAPPRRLTDSAACPAPADGLARPTGAPSTAPPRPPQCPTDGLAHLASADGAARSAPPARPVHQRTAPPARPMP